MKILRLFTFITFATICTNTYANTDQIILKSISHCKFDVNNDGMLSFEVKGKNSQGEDIHSTNIFDANLMEVCKNMIFKVMDEPEKYDLKLQEGSEYFCELIRE